MQPIRRYDTIVVSFYVLICVYNLTLIVKHTDRQAAQIEI